VDFDIKYGYIGGAAIDRYSNPLPEKTKELCLNSDAVLLGSVGGASWDHLSPELKPELGGLLELRKLLKLYANLRPVIVYDELKEYSPLKLKNLKGKLEIVIVRELANGIYFGKPKKLSKKRGVDTMVYNRKDIENIGRIGFEIAGRRGKKLSSVDKSNVLYSSILWRRVIEELSKGYPDIEVEHLYVDNAAMQLILNPLRFDVILTSNLFGDILSDELAALVGSLGMIPSASFGEKTHLFEPAGGSAPDIAGMKIANPIAQILSVAMMLEHSFDMREASKDIYSAVESIIKEGFRTKDITFVGKYISTSKMGDLISERI